MRLPSNCRRADPLQNHPCKMKSSRAFLIVMLLAPLAAMHGAEPAKRVGNEIAFRVRGPGKRGGAHVVIKERAIYETQVGVRAEHKIEQLTLSGLAFGKGVAHRIHFHNGDATAGFLNTGERTAPPMETLLENGFPAH